MPVQPACQLDPRIKPVWRIRALLTIVLCVIPVWLTGLLICSEEAPGFSGTWNIICLIILAACLILFCGILPSLRFIRWRYEMTEHHLEIKHGIIWRTQLLVPFIRVQDTNTDQGPLMRAFKIASVTVSTAADSHSIPGIAVEDADKLRMAIAEQARLAREEQ